jgi:hypothetical protein
MLTDAVKDGSEESGYIRFVHAEEHTGAATILYCSILLHVTYFNFTSYSMSHMQS